MTTTGATTPALGPLLSPAGSPLGSAGPHFQSAEVDAGAMPSPSASPLAGGEGSNPEIPGRCRRCGRPVRLTPFGLGHVSLVARICEADRHRPVMARA